MSDENTASNEKQVDKLEPHEELNKLCWANAEYFSKDNSENGQRLYISFLSIKDTIDQIWPKVLNVQKVAPNYDYDPTVPGNGYRSFLSIMNAAVSLAADLNRKVVAKRDSVLFRKAVITKDIESCAHVISSLASCFEHLENLISGSEDGDLFPKEQRSVEEIFAPNENINQYCFYGRTFGFQFCESIRSVLKFIILSMAVFSEAYYSEGSVLSKATNSVVTTTKFFTDPEERAKRIVNISQNAGVDFCKAFWFLAESELMHHIPSIVAPSVAVSKIIHLPPEPLTLTIDNVEIEVPIPSSHIGTKPVQVRLISYEAHEGMMGEANAKHLQPPSRGLLIHCHGGGFVAQSSKSHETYLRQWAKELNVPILSIDYSLAPHAPFPRALEEVTYAYGWALKNFHLLGSTGERIVAAGDSAGANLLLSSSLKCLDLGLPTPMGIFTAYVPTLVNIQPSPARMLCLMDPLLPFGFLMRCLKAYASQENTNNAKAGSVNGSDSESFEEISESDLMELQAHKSPVSETSDTLTYGSFNSQDSRNDETVKGKNGESIMSNLLEKFVLDSDTDTDGSKIPVLTQETSSSSSQTFSSSFQGRVSSLLSNLKGRFDNLIPKKSPSGAVKVLEGEKQQSWIDEFRFTVPTDPYLSPYCASDENLKKMPPIKILTVHLDPCLDDCVMFAKRLKRLNHDVSLDLLSGLPHGFLNFSMVCKEAYEGSQLCAQRILELLDLDGLPPRQT